MSNFHTTDESKLATDIDESNDSFRIYIVHMVTVETKEDLSSDVLSESIRMDVHERFFQVENLSLSAIEEQER